MALGIGWVLGWLFCGGDWVIYVFCFMPDVYSLPFLKNQDAEEVLGGQEGSPLRGHIYVFFRCTFVLEDAPSRKWSSCKTPLRALRLDMNTKGFSLSYKCKSLKAFLFFFLSVSTSHTDAQAHLERLGRNWVALINISDTFEYQYNERPVFNLNF